MHSPDDGLTAAITAAGGAIPFDQFMDLALYGPGGFYTTGGSAGRRGDFITSPEVGPLFGEVLARAVTAEWEAQGRPAQFTVVEAGAGPGTLARSLLPALTGAGCCGNGSTVSYVAVEISAAQRERHPDTVTSVAGLPAALGAGVVIANELLDNLPFRLAVFDGAWREAFVTTTGGTYAEVLSAPLDPVPSFLPDRAPHGARVPLQDRAAAWVKSARGLLSRGRVIAIDYCTPRTAELALTPWRSWLRTYRGHERGGHYLAQPGSQDITAQVCVDQLPEPDEVRTQAQFLARWGINDLVDEGRRAWAAAASSPNLAAMKMRSRVTEHAALTDPTGLGDFTVLEWRAVSA